MTTRSHHALLAGAAAVALGVVPLAAHAQWGDGHCGQEGRFHARMADMDTDADGLVTADEFAVAHDARFASSDANGDGYLDRDEIVAMHPRIDDPDGRPGPDLDRVADHMLQRGDTDGDGRVSRDEAAAVHAERFAAVDENGDGVIDGDEQLAARAGFHGGPGGMGPGPHGPLLRMDTDGDGAVTRDEFEAGMQEHWDALDSNDDGVIDSADRPEDDARGPRPGGGPHGRGPNGPGR